MKLRIKQNSLRLRLTRSEVARIADGLPVIEETRFPGGRRLCYVLTVSADATTVVAALEGATVTVSLPVSVARRWSQTDEVSIDASVSLGNSAELQVLVEKDFKCLVDTRDDESDAFPNPNASRPGTVERGDGRS